MTSKMPSRPSYEQQLTLFLQQQQSDKPPSTQADPRPGLRLLLQLCSHLLSNRLRESSKPILLSLAEKTLSSLTLVEDHLTSLSDPVSTSDDPFQSPT